MKINSNILIIVFLFFMSMMYLIQKKQKKRIQEKFWGKVGKFIKKVADQTSKSVTDTIWETGDLIKSGSYKVSDVATHIAYKTGEGFEVFGDKLSGAVYAVGDGFDFVFTDVIWGMALKDFVNAAIATLKSMAEGLAELGDGFTNGLANCIKRATEFGQKLGEYIGKGAVIVWGGIVTAANSFGEFIMNLADPCWWIMTSCEVAVIMIVMAMKGVAAGPLELAWSQLWDIMFSTCTSQITRNKQKFAKLAKKHQETQDRKEDARKGRRPGLTNQRRKGKKLKKEAIKNAAIFFIQTMIASLVTPFLSPIIGTLLLSIAPSGTVEGIKATIIELITWCLANYIVNRAMGTNKGTRVDFGLTLSFIMTSVIKGFMCDGRIMGIYISEFIPGFVPIIAQASGCTDEIERKNRIKDKKFGYGSNAKEEVKEKFGYDNNFDENKMMEDFNKQDDILGENWGEIKNCIIPGTNESIPCNELEEYCTGNYEYPNGELTPKDEFGNNYASCDDMLTKEEQCKNSVNYLGIKNIGKEITVTRKESNGKEIQKTEISPYSSCQLKQESEAYCAQQKDWQRKNFSSCAHLRQGEWQCYRFKGPDGKYYDQKNGKTACQNMQDGEAICRTKQDQNDNYFQNCETGETGSMYDSYLFGLENCKRHTNHLGINYTDCQDMKAGELNCKTRKGTNNINFTSCRDEIKGNTNCQRFIDAAGNNYDFNTDKSITPCQNYHLGEEKCKSKKNHLDNNYISCEEYRKGEEFCKKNFYDFQNNKFIFNNPNNYQFNSETKEFSGETACEVMKKNEDNCKQQKDSNGINFSSCYDKIKKTTDALNPEYHCKRDGYVDCEDMKEKTFGAEYKLQEGFSNTDGLNKTFVPRFLCPTEKNFSKEFDGFSCKCDYEKGYIEKDLMLEKLDEKITAINNQSPEYKNAQKSWRKVDGTWTEMTELEDYTLERNEIAAKEEHCVPESLICNDSDTKIVMNDYVWCTKKDHRVHPVVNPNKSAAHAGIRGGGYVTQRRYNNYDSNFAYKGIFKAPKKYTRLKNGRMGYVWQYVNYDENNPLHREAATFKGVGDVIRDANDNITKVIKLERYPGSYNYDSGRYSARYGRPNFLPRYTCTNIKGNPAVNRDLNNRYFSIKDKGGNVNSFLTKCKISQQLNNHTFLKSKMDQYNREKECRRGYVNDCDTMRNLNRGERFDELDCITKKNKFGETYDTCEEMRFEENECRKIKDLEGKNFATCEKLYDANLKCQEQGFSSCQDMKNELLCKSKTNENGVKYNNCEEMNTSENSCRQQMNSEGNNFTSCQDIVADKACKEKGYKNCSDMASSLFGTTNEGFTNVSDESIDSDVNNNILIYNQDDSSFQCNTNLGFKSEFNGVECRCDVNKHLVSREYEINRLQEILNDFPKINPGTWNKNYRLYQNNRRRKTPFYKYTNSYLHNWKYWQRNDKKLTLEEKIDEIKEKLKERISELQSSQDLCVERTCPLGQEIIVIGQTKYCTEIKDGYKLLCNQKSGYSYQNPFDLCYNKITSGDQKTNLSVDPAEYCRNIETQNTSFENVCLKRDLLQNLKNVNKAQNVWYESKCKASNVIDGGASYTSCQDKENREREYRINQREEECRSQTNIFNRSNYTSCQEKESAENRCSQYKNVITGEEYKSCQEMETGEGICKEDGFDYTRNDDNTDIISLPCQNKKENECQQIQGFNEETLEFYSYPNCNEKEEKEVICQEMDYANCKEKGEEILRENICKNNLDFNAENYNSCQEMNEKESECQQMSNGYTNYKPIKDLEGNIIKQSCQVARESEIKCKNLSDFEGINYKSCIDMKAGEDNCKTLSFIDGENYLSCEQARTGETICQEGIDLDGINYMKTDDKTACDIARASEESCKNMTNVDGERYELNDEEGKCAQVRTFCRNKKGLDNNNYASCSEYELGENNCKNMKNFEGQNYSSCLEARPQELVCKSKKKFGPPNRRQNYSSCADAKRGENWCKRKYFTNIENVNYNNCDEASAGEAFCKSKKFFNPYRRSRGKDYTEGNYTNCQSARKWENWCKANIRGIGGDEDGYRVYDYTRDDNGNIIKTRCENAKEAELKCKEMKNYYNEPYLKSRRYPTYCHAAAKDLKGENFCKALKNYEGVYYNSCDEARPQEEKCVKMIDKNFEGRYNVPYRNKLEGEGPGKRYFSACENARLKEEACRKEANDRNMNIPLDVTELLYDSQGNLTTACDIISNIESDCEKNTDLAGNNYANCNAMNIEENICQNITGIDGTTKYANCLEVKEAIIRDANLSDDNFPILIYLPKTNMKDLVYVNRPSSSFSEFYDISIDNKKTELLNLIEDELKTKCTSNIRGYKNTNNFKNCLLNDAYFFNAISVRYQNKDENKIKSIRGSRFSSNNYILEPNNDDNGLMILINNLEEYNNLRDKFKKYLSDYIGHSRFRLNYNDTTNLNDHTLISNHIFTKVSSSNKIVPDEYPVFSSEVSVNQSSWPRFYYFPSLKIKFAGGGKFSTNNREIKFNTDLIYTSIDGTTLSLPKEQKYGKSVVNVNNLATYLKNSNNENYDFITTFSPQSNLADPKNYFEKMKANKTSGELNLENNVKHKGLIIKINDQEHLNKLTNAFKTYKEKNDAKLPKFQNKFLRDNVEEHRIPEVWPRFYYFPSSKIKFAGGGKFSTNNREIKFNTDLIYTSIDGTTLSLPKEQKYGKSVVNVNNLATYLKNSNNENYDFITTFSPQSNLADPKNYFEKMKANKTSGDIKLESSQRHKGLIIKINNRDHLNELTNAFKDYKENNDAKLRQFQNKFLGENLEEHRISTVKIQ